MSSARPLQGKDRFGDHPYCNKAPCGERLSLSVPHHLNGPRICFHLGHAPQRTHFYFIIVSLSRPRDPPTLRASGYPRREACANKDGTPSRASAELRCRDLLPSTHRFTRLFPPSALPFHLSMGTVSTVSFNLSDCCKDISMASRHRPLLDALYAEASSRGQGSTKLDGMAPAICKHHCKDADARRSSAETGR